MYQQSQCTYIKFLIRNVSSDGWLNDNAQKVKSWISPSTINITYTSTIVFSGWQLTAVYLHFGSTVIGKANSDMTTSSNQSFAYRQGRTSQDDYSGVGHDTRMASNRQLITFLAQVQSIRNIINKTVYIVVRDI